jgi:lipopolysaccharide transport system permease protein
VFAFTALLPWNLFSFALSESSNSLVGSQNLITKVYFPRLVIPMASVIAGIVDFGIAFCVLIAMMIYYGIHPTIAIVLLPVFVLFALATALSVGLWLSALNVKYRDIRYIIPFLTQIWLYATPVAFPASIIPEPWRSLSGLNPMAGVVEGFRWALLGTSHPPGTLLWVSVAAVAVLLIGGLTYFRRMESSFADIA